jgi:23S rRNA pseudouridine1911/1915/1917 synthase
MSQTRGAMLDRQKSEPDRSRSELRVLRETPYEVIVIKPAGMPSELTSDPRGVSLLSRLRRAYPHPLKPKLPHRLDRVTRGVMLVTLTQEAIAFQNEEIRARRWGKFYLARVHQPSNRDIPSLIGRHKAYLKTVRHRAKIVRSGGKPSFLDILAIRPAPDHPGQYHVLVQLLTGRFHQVRAMLAGLGLPLVGDRFYADDGLRGQAGMGWSDFYLEHILLQYVDYGSRTPQVAHLRDDPDREPMTGPMKADIEALLG